MQLNFNSIALQNFGSFAGQHKFQLDRQPELFFITGKNNVEQALTTNGVGKSTLFNALYWVLTGKTLRQQRPGNSVECWYGKGTVAVSLELTIDGQIYTITRTRRPNSLTLNGSVVEQSTINKLIRLNEETLKRTILVGQFVPLFLELRPEQQSSLFSEALNLDLWLKASEKANTATKILDSKRSQLELTKATLEGKATQLKLQYDIEIKREKEYATTLKTRLANLEIELTSNRAELASAENAFQASYGTGTDNTAPSPFDAALRSQRASNAKIDMLIRSIGTELRITQGSHKRLETKLAQYQASNNKCPECKQLVDAQHILTKSNELMFAISQLSQILLQLEKDYNEANASLNDAAIKTETLEREYEAERKATLVRQREELLLESRVQNYRTAVLTTEKEIANLKSAPNPYTAMCESLAEQFCLMREQIEALELEITEIIAEGETYKMWTGAYKEIRLNLIDEVLSELELASNRHVQLLGLDNWRIEFKTERENKSGTVSHSFTTLIYPSGQVQPITFESYSGGESQRLQLAVTAGLSEVLLSRAGIDINIEIYDESSKSLSQQGVEDLLNCLKERAYDLKRSIYFVDHASVNHGIFSEVITIEKGDNGSRIV